MTPMKPVNVEAAIAAGRSGADLIPWNKLCISLFGDWEPDPMRAIEESQTDFEMAGWTWNREAKQLEKDGWLIWYRSQGLLSPPIIQWSRIRPE